MKNNSYFWSSLLSTGSFTFRDSSCSGEQFVIPKELCPFGKVTTWVKICLSLCRIWIVSLCFTIRGYIHEINVFYLLKIMKITLLNMKIKEYTLNMIFNCSCDRRTRCIKNWNAQWDIWLVHSHENLIFTFVLLLTFKTVPCGHFCIFLTGLKNNNAYQRSAPWGFAEIWRIWGFVGWFAEFCAL